MTSLYIGAKVGDLSRGHWDTFISDKVQDRCNSSIGLSLSATELLLIGDFTSNVYLFIYL